MNKLAQQSNDVNEDSLQETNWRMVQIYYTQANDESRNNYRTAWQQIHKQELFY